MENLSKKNLALVEELDRSTLNQDLDQFYGADIQSFYPCFFDWRWDSESYNKQELFAQWDEPIF